MIINEFKLAYFLDMESFEFRYISCGATFALQCERTSAFSKTETDSPPRRKIFKLMSGDWYPNEELQEAGRRFLPSPLEHLAFSANVNKTIWKRNYAWASNVFIHKNVIFMCNDIMNNYDVIFKISLRTSASFSVATSYM